jgi:hypothetical protein
MAEWVNHGISGGNVSARNLAVGQNARVYASAADPRLAQQLEVLLAAIAAFDGDPEVRRELATAGDEVADALARPAPDGRRALSRLSTIRTLADSTGAIAGAATALAGLVGAF